MNSIEFEARPVLKQDQNADPIHTFIGLIPEMIDQARTSAEQNAISHRDFHVGATAFFVDSAGQGFTYDSANYKIEPDSPKVCAEMDILFKLDQGYDENKIVGFVIAGTSDVGEIEDVNGHKTDTLHPCADCIKALDASHAVDDDTLFVTVGLDKDVVQVQTFGEMKLSYASLDPAKVPAQIFEDLDWFERQDIYYQMTQGLVHLEQSDPRRIVMARMALAGNHPAELSIDLPASK